MDDERQARLARGRDVDAQALLLHPGAVGGVVVVEPAFADADEFRMLGQGDQLVDRGQRLIGGAHRVGAGGPEDGVMGLGDGAHLRGLPQFRADRHHAAHAGGHGPSTISARSASKSGKSRWQWLSTISKLGGVSHRLGPRGVRGAGIRRRARPAAPRSGRDRGTYRR
jgi:hypothetical protein